MAVDFDLSYVRLVKSFAAIEISRNIGSSEMDDIPVADPIRDNPSSGDGDASLKAPGPGVLPAPSPLTAAIETSIPDNLNDAMRAALDQQLEGPEREAVDWRHGQRSAAASLAGLSRPSLSTVSAPMSKSITIDDPQADGFDDSQVREAGSRSAGSSSSPPLSGVSAVKAEGGVETSTGSIDEKAAGETYPVDARAAPDKESRTSRLLHASALSLFGAAGAADALESMVDAGMSEAASEVGMKSGDADGPGKPLTGLVEGRNTRLVGSSADPAVTTVASSGELGEATGEAPGGVDEAWRVNVTLSGPKPTVAQRADGGASMPDPPDPSMLSGDVRRQIRAETSPSLRPAEAIPDHEFATASATFATSGNSTLRDAGPFMIGDTMRMTDKVTAQATANDDSSALAIDGAASETSVEIKTPLAFSPQARELLDTLAALTVAGEPSADWEPLSMIILNAAMIPGWPPPRPLENPALLQKPDAAAMSTEITEPEANAMTPEQMIAYLVSIGANLRLLKALTDLLRRIEAKNGPALLSWLAGLVSTLKIIEKSLKDMIDDGVELPEWLKDLADASKRRQRKQFHI